MASVDRSRTSKCSSAEIDFLGTCTI
jgi:hypothetical protein